MAAFDYNRLRYDDRELIHNALASTTVKHIANSNGLFAPRAFEPAANESQMLEITHLPPAPAKFDGDFGINQLADIANGRLHQATQEELKRQRAFVSAAELRRREGHHQFHLTTHQTLPDVAIYAASWAEATSINHDNWQDDNGLGISRGITTVEAFGMTAAEVVKKIGHVFMSFPRTHTIEELVEEFKMLQLKRLEENSDADEVDIDSLISTNNRDMRGEIRAWLGIDATRRVQRIGRHAIGRYFNWAIEGATTRVRLGDNHKPEAIQLGKVSKGITDVLKHGYSQPIVLWDQDDPIVELGELTIVRTKDDVDRVQEWQRSTLAKRLGLPDDAVTIEALAA